MWQKIGIKIGIYDDKINWFSVNLQQQCLWCHSLSEFGNRENMVGLRAMKINYFRSFFNLKNSWKKHDLPETFGIVTASFRSPK